MKTDLMPGYGRMAPARWAKRCWVPDGVLELPKGLVAGPLDAQGLCQEACGPVRLRALHQRGPVVLLNCVNLGRDLISMTNH